MSEETQKNTFLAPSAAACSSSTGNMTSKYKTLQFTNDDFIDHSFKSIPLYTYQRVWSFWVQMTSIVTQK